MAFNALLKSRCFFTVQNASLKLRAEVAAASSLGFSNSSPAFVRVNVTLFPGCKPNDFLNALGMRTWPLGPIFISSFGILTTSYAFV